MVCFFGAWDEGKRQADACAEFYWIDRLIFSIQTPLYPYALTSPMAALALFMWQTRDVSPSHLITPALVERNPIFNRAGPHWSPVLGPCTTHSLSRGAPRIGEQASSATTVCSLYTKTEICPLLLPRGSVVCQQGGHVSE